LPRGFPSNLLLSSPTIIHRKLLELAIPVDCVFLSWKLDITLQFRAKLAFFLYLLYLFYKEIAEPSLSSYQRNSIHSFPLLFLLIPFFKKNKLFYNFLFYKIIELLLINTIISYHPNVLSYIKCIRFNRQFLCFFWCFCRLYYRCFQF